MKLLNKLIHKISDSHSDAEHNISDSKLLAKMHWEPDILNNILSISNILIISRILVISRS